MFGSCVTIKPNDTKAQGIKTDKYVKHGSSW